MQTGEGKSKREIMRCLKRYAAREIYRQITNPRPAPDNSDLRRRRTDLGMTLTTVAGELGQWVSIISRLERGHIRNDALAGAYRKWLIDQAEMPRRTPPTTAAARTNALPGAVS
ncbi:hypothetical protein [Arthrobacter sp. fls2-241-R2A-172]|uniref:hypothetical protein n=1 Tax=Arthrobacter sp. fls2-241-R2A-172 TaxID=3040325 RepID=UPI00254D666B|nr:hypothetical protein [Arthrobacter sp. fls2-241-R2A-172]